MALFRALESARRPAKRLFKDPLARRLLDCRLRLVVRLSRVPVIGIAIPWFIDRRWPGARTSAVARTRLIDDALGNALHAGVGQVVILGAGFDCRAYRIPGIEHTRVFEVDHPATLAAKKERVAQRLGALPAHVVYVGVDFNRQTLAEAMEPSGFDPTVRTFFIWEGVTNYLTAEAVDATLRYVRAHAAPGSQLLFTYVHRGVLDGSVPFAGTENLVNTLARAGEPWTFGFHPQELPAYLRVRGFELMEDVGATEYRSRYWGTRARRLRGYEFYRAALAEVRDTSE